MAERDLKRRLTTIVAADVVEYARLVHDDEEGTLRALRTHRQELFDPLIEKYGGRIANTAGDSLLLEFPSAVEAVRCAIAVQEGLTERNGEIPEAKQIRLRIGVNIGDIISEGKDLLGDGVNVAARLEAQAAANSILISNSVYDQIRDKLELAVEDMGEIVVKNISRPVRTFRIIGKNDTTAAAKRRFRPFILLAATILIALMAAVGYWRFLGPLPDRSMSKSATVKPSIAVLPFDSMSGGEADDSFADGLTEDLITDLSKISGLVVIARNTMFTYKGRTVKVSDIAKELRVRYALEGSVRRAGNKIRINAQLIDAHNDTHLWADRFDGSLKDVFELQDKVTGMIVQALAIELNPQDKLNISTRGTRNLQAYEAHLVGLRHLNNVGIFKPDETLAAQAAFEKAIALDPKFASAYAGLAWTYWFQSKFNHGVATQSREYRQRSFETAKRSLELAETSLAFRLLAVHHSKLSFDGSFSVPTLGGERRYDEALKEMRKALEVAPNDADTNAEYAGYLVFAGDWQAAKSHIDLAIRLNPNQPNWYHRIAGIIAYLSKDYPTAVREFRHWFEGEKRVATNAGLWLAASRAKSNDITGAKDVLKKVRVGQFEHLAIPAIPSLVPLRKQEHLGMLLDGLRLAGMPDPR